VISRTTKKIGPKFHYYRTANELETFRLCYCSSREYCKNLRLDYGRKCTYTSDIIALPPSLSENTNARLLSFIASHTRIRAFVRTTSSSLIVGTAFAAASSPTFFQSLCYCRMRIRVRVHTYGTYRVRRNIVKTTSPCKSR